MDGLEINLVFCRNFLVPSLITTIGRDCYLPEARNGRQDGSRDDLLFILWSTWYRPLLEERILSWMDHWYDPVWPFSYADFHLCFAAEMAGPDCSARARGLGSHLTTTTQWEYSPRWKLLNTEVLSTSHRWDCLQSTAPFFFFWLQLNFALLSLGWARMESLSTLRNQIASLSFIQGNSMNCVGVWVYPKASKGLPHHILVGRSPYSVQLVSYSSHSSCVSMQLP